METAEPEAAPETETAASAEETEPLGFQPPEVLPSAPAVVEATIEPEAETAAGDTVNAVESEVTQPAPAAPEIKPAPIPEPLIGEDDTKSIWERFGIPRPSEIEPVPAVEAAPAVAVEAPAPPATPSFTPIALPAAPPRTGLRIVLRRKLVRLRRPSVTP